MLSLKSYIHLTNDWPMNNKLACLLVKKQIKMLGHMTSFIHIAYVTSAMQNMLFYFNIGLSISEPSPFLKIFTISP